MVDLASQSDLTTRATAKPSSSTWNVYGRLVGYAWNYKGRLIVSILLAIIIAASFGTMLVSVGTVIKLTFYDPTPDAVTGEVPEDPAARTAEDIRDVTATMEKFVGWGPVGLDERFLGLVDIMRHQPMRALTVACVVVLILALVIGIARYLQEYYAGAIGTYITTDLGEAMYANLMRQSMDFFESHSSGDILARFTNDIFMVNRGLSGVFVKLMREPFKALAFLAVAVSVDPLLTFVGLCILPPVLYALIRIGKKVRKSVRRSLQKIASMASVVNETVNGITIVKGYNMEEYEISRVQREIVKLRKFLLHMIKADAATGPVTEFILVVGVVLFVMFSGQRVISGTLHPGDLVTLYFSLAMMLDPVRKLSSVNNMIQTSVASAERVFEFIDVQPSIVEADGAVRVPPLQTSIQFEDVHFSYDGKHEVLKGISFEAVKGEMIALVGFSGAGKSTLVKLIPRFYDVTGGAIKIDGLDIRKATFHSLRDLIGIVTQDTVLFDETVRDNIAFGRNEYDADRVSRAAKAAHADEFVTKLPQGYETPLGAAGSILSGGQRQRLAIARAIIKDPRILILDEATSSLDSESERLIQQALNEFVEGRTTFVIAHRLSTIQRADRILVLDQGRIAEQGTHEELLRAGGIYQRLYETQFAPAAAN